MQHSANPEATPQAWGSTGGSRRKETMRILEGAAMLAALIGAQVLAVGVLFVH